MAASIVLSSLAGGGAAAETASSGVERVESAAARSNDGAVFGGSLFRRRVEVAARQVRSELRSARGRSCLAYFSDQQVDLDAWLDLEGPPYVKEVSRSSARELQGAAQAGPPFQWVFIGGHAARSADACQLGSLLLHELGHLARRDVTDNEPPEFFSRCRLSACIDAGRYR